MKTGLSLFYFLIIICSSILITAKAEAVNVNDSLALVDLYNSTNGHGWIVHTHWLTRRPVKTWYGVAVAGTRVTRIILRNNALHGVIPESIGSLSRLDSLDLGHNYDLTGQIPSSIGKLTNLTFLKLETCKFNGHIPAAIGNLKKLLYLNVLDNRLSGVIPSSIGKLDKIQYINLAVNQLIDTIPAVVGDLTSLTDLYLSDNMLTGSIPSSVGKLVNVLNLVLRNNGLSGILPPSLGNLIHLQYSYFDRNNLVGGIPNSIISLKNLILLDLSKNRLAFNHNIDTSARLGNSQVLMDIGYNNFTFDGTEFFGQKNKYPNVTYTPQAQLAIHKQADTLSVSAGGTLSNNTYTWFKIGKADSLIVKGDSVIHPATSGKYYATIANSIATELTLYTDTITYTAPAVNNENRITIYPDPVRDVLTIIRLDANINNNIIIADVTGHVWLSTEVKQQSIVKLNMSKLKPGYYVLNIRNSNFSGTIKFIKE